MTSKVQFSLDDGSALIKPLRRLGFQWIPQTLPREIIAAVMIAWVPLVILTAGSGVAFGHKVRIPFLADLVQYARFWVALPCVLGLGRFVNPRLEKVLNSFLGSRIVSTADLDRFQSAIARARSLTSSMLSESTILAFVYFYTWFGLQRDISYAISSWNQNCPAAGWWFRWISMPLLLFFTCLWIWRLGVWAYLLYQISRLNLRVVATHPDGVGGLNFVNVGIRRFCVLVFAISSILCASIGEEILFSGAGLRDYELELALFFILCLSVILGPLMVFTPALVRSKLDFWGRYGPLSSRYVQGFDDKWASPAGASRQDLLGTPDIQSLADLGHGYSVISQMRTILPNRNTIGIFAIAYVLPAIPLLSSVISLRRVFSEVYTLLLK